MQATDTPSAWAAAPAAPTGAEPGSSQAASLLSASCGSTVSKVLMKVCSPELEGSGPCLLFAVCVTCPPAVFLRLLPREGAAELGR